MDKQANPSCFSPASVMKYLEILLTIFHLFYKTLKGDIFKIILKGLLLKYKKYKTINQMTEDIVDYVLIMLIV